MTSLDDRIGQLFCCGWQGSSASESRSASIHARRLIEELLVGGIILMGRNLGSAAEVALLVGELQALSPTPLWIGIDQEGGAVARFTQPGLAFPGNMALGAARDAALAERAAGAIGEQLRAMGVTMNFVPTLDVNNNPLNPIIGTRSFGEDPALVAELGVAAARGYRSAGVVPVGKHFPGHGDTDVDSHLDLPVQAAPRARLEAVELASFRAAVEGGHPGRAEVIPALMTTHILFPALDPELPATLSRRVLTGLLREEWGYNGVIVTDCLEMHGIAARWGPEEAAVLALEAGADLLLVCHTWETQRRMVAAVRDAVRAGRLSEARIDASVERLVALKRATGPTERHRPDPEAAAATVGAERYRALEREVARAALTVLNNRGVIPLRRESRVRLAGPAAAVESLAAFLRERGVNVATRDDPAERTVLLLDGAPTASPAVGADIVAAMRGRYVLARYRAAGCRIACYSSRPCALEALADLLVGNARATSRLPVTVAGDVVCR